MKPEEFKSAAQAAFGTKRGWQAACAEFLGVHRITVWRWSNKGGARRHVLEALNAVRRRDTGEEK